MFGCWLGLYEENIPTPNTNQAVAIIGDVLGGDSKNGPESCTGDRNSNDDQPEEGEANVAQQQQQKPAFLSGPWAFETFLDINEKLSSHSHRREAVETLNSSPFIAFTHVSHRAGWFAKTIHSIFDYINNNKSNDEQCGKVFGDWTTPGCSGKIGGGHPPRLWAIIKAEDDPEKLDLVRRHVATFSWSLFENHHHDFLLDSTGTSVKKIQLLTAAALMRLSQFVDILAEHPGRKFGNPEVLSRDDFTRACFHCHPFLNKMKTIAMVAGVMDPVVSLMTWGDRILRDFVERNLFFIDFETLVKCEGHEAFKVDTRTIAQLLDHLLAEVRFLHHYISNILPRSHSQ
jgi:hypothetical protein